MPYYAVIDTNVIVSAMLTKNYASATVQVVTAIFTGKIIPLYNTAILEEYDEVLHRDKFHLKDETIRKLLTVIQNLGLEVQPLST